jgi:hypothetical protein
MGIYRLEGDMDLPERMIHQSFRYCLGRMTYAVKEWCDWAVANWDKIPTAQKGIIKRELEEAFEQDARMSHGNSPYSRLGHDVDKEQWKRVRGLYDTRIT